MRILHCETANTFDTKLETITGVGTTLAAVIFSEIGGDIKKCRFYERKRSEGFELQKEDQEKIKKIYPHGQTTTRKLNLPYPTS